MKKNEYLVIYYISHGWNKREIMNSLGLERKSLEVILKKYNLKISDSGMKRAARINRSEYAKKNIIIRGDKRNRECPFICVTVHKKLKTAKKAVYSLSIRDDGKKLRIRSKNLVQILKSRNKFLRENNPGKLKQVRDVEFQWFLRHPFCKFTVPWLIQLFPKH